MGPAFCWQGSRWEGTLVESEARPSQIVWNTGEIGKSKKAAGVAAGCHSSFNIVGLSKQLEQALCQLARKSATAAATFKNAAADGGERVACLVCSFQFQSLQ